MKATAFIEPGKVEIHEVAKPEVQLSGDAIIKIVRACVCGSDLWFYRGIQKMAKDSRVGHEASESLKKSAMRLQM